MLTLCFHIYVRGKYYHHTHMRTHYVLRQSSNICFAHSFCSNSIEYWHFQHGRELQWFKATREIKIYWIKRKTHCLIRTWHTYTLSILWFYWMENYKNWIQWIFASSVNDKEALMNGSYFCWKWKLNLVLRTNIENMIFN